MRQYVDAHTIANTIRMNRSQHTGAFVIVEGSSDVRVYKRFFDTVACRLVPALGKANATGALKMLEAERVEGILAVIDSDFWVLDGIHPDSENLLVTDTHDLETMILSSNALEKVLDEFCSKKVLDEYSTTVRSMMLDIGRPLGFFRWMASSKHENMSLRFKNLHYHKFIAVKNNSVTINIRGLVREVRMNTGNFMYNEKEIAGRLQKLINENHHDPWHVCRGHDLVAILTFLIHDVFGNRRSKMVTKDVVDSLLRLSYEYRYFRDTKLYSGIKVWENNNKSYRILYDN